MKHKVASPFRMVLPLAVALSLFTSLLTSVPSASADGATGPTQSSGAGAVSTYTVIYNGNGNTSGTAPMDSTAYASGTTVNVASQGTLVKSGSTFGGWASGGSTGPGTTYQTGQTFSILSNTILTAIWTAKPYTITYLGNINTGGSAPSPTIGLIGATVHLANNTGALVKNSFFFNGWATHANGSGSSYAVGSPYTLTANLTLYAKWVHRITKPYTITYLGNTNTGGSAPSPTIGSGLVHLANNTGALVRSGSSFAGWNTQPNGFGTTYAIAATYTLNANRTLYAKWIRAIVKPYTITYNGNGATAGHIPGPTIGSGLVHLANNAGALARSSFSFGGWNTQTNGLGTTYAIASTYTLNANRTLYAKWISVIVKPYTITYLGNGNTGGNAPSPYVGSGSATLANRGNLTLLVVWPCNGLANPGCSNSTLTLNFTGWNTQPNNWLSQPIGLGTHYAAGSSLNLTANVTLYAEWNVNYAITYLGNGNTNGNVPNPTLFNSGSPLGVAANSGILAKSGFTFYGWNTQADGLGTDWAVGSTNYAIADFTLYAKWTAISCATAGPCVIGDTGPGGGTVFYSSQTAFTSLGSACNTACHYLEAAPNTWSGASADPLMPWAVNAYLVTSVAGTSVAIGTGLANTNLIVAQGNNATTAAGAARAYTGGNKQDWYLPSKNELSEMNLHYSAVGAFVSSAYWSSTQWSTPLAHFEATGWPGLSLSVKYSFFHVRPVRAF